MEAVSKSISWICQDCGLKHGERRNTLSTWHIGDCDVCGKMKAVTEGRDFGVRHIPAQKS